MQNDEKDRHIAAAAVKAGAQVIVTSNLDDFDRCRRESRLSRRTNFFATYSTSTRLPSWSCWLSKRRISNARP
jgi:hypothetical protein